MRVDIEVLREMRQERQRINSVALSSISLFVEGKRRYISAEDIKEWKFIGLSNVDFLMERLGI